MPKLHFTSLLRPRASYKTTTAPNSDTNDKQHLLNNDISTNTIALIPNLEFVNTPAVATFTLSQQCLDVCLRLDETQEQQHNVSTRNSSATYTAERTSSERHQKQEEASPSSSIDTIELLQQDVQPFSLTDTASFTTYFDEPTSSVSLGIMDNTQTSKALSEQRSTTDHIGISTTPTISKNTTTAATSSQSNVPKKLPTLCLSETGTDDGEEEEIEEALEMSEEQDFSVSLPGPSRKPQNDQLFGIELSDSSSEELKAVDQNSNSCSLRTTSEEDKFKIDDKQLSGGNLAQHFTIDNEESENNKEINTSLGGLHSKHESTGFEDDFNVDTRGEEEKEEDSLTNQSTADDVSELQEEEKMDPEVLSQITDNKFSEQSDAFKAKDNVKSTKSEASEKFALTEHQLKTEVSKNLKEEIQKVLKPSRPELFENPDIKPLSGASSLHSEKDHSIEEIIVSNQSLEMTFDEKDLSSLNPSFDIHNETLINDLLSETPEKSQISNKTKNSAKKNEIIEKTKIESGVATSMVPEHIQVLPDNKSQENPKAKNKNFLDSPQKLNETTNVCIIPKEEVEEEIFESGLESKEIITDLDDSFHELEEKPMTSTQSVKEMQNNVSKCLSLKEHQAKIEQLEPFSTLQLKATEEDDDETSLQLMKLRIMAMQIETKDNNIQLSPIDDIPVSLEDSQTKVMERASLVDFAKDVLEDITEESERNSLSIPEDQNSMAHEKSATLTSKSESKTLHYNMNTNSIASLNMIEVLQQKVEELQHKMLASKDACLTSLNLQLENCTRRDSQNNNNSSELLGSGRDSSSLVTNSTDYRTLQEDFGQPTLDIYMELSKRDELITKLNESLQQSISIRESLQAETEKLTNDVVLLRKQLTEAMEYGKKSIWPRDQESNYGQRISEISMDLISESDDDLDRLYLTDNEEKISRNSRERQLSMPRQYDYSTTDVEIPCDSTAFSKQIEQFQKYLTPSEVRLFFMVQKKFDDYLCQELEKSKMKFEQELKIVMDQWDNEKKEKGNEILKLIHQRQEREAKHNQEMEDLRKYFESKCADLEKQFSDDVFSQKSQRHGMESSSASECSDEEQLLHDFNTVTPTKSKESSPRKRCKAELLLSPSHRQMTPGNDAFNEDTATNEGAELAMEINELKSFYQNKIHEIQRFQEDTIKKLSDRVKYYESRYPEDEFMTSTKNSTLNSTNETTTTSHSEDLTQTTIRNINQTPNKNQPNESHVAESLASASPMLSNNNNSNTSLIIIDQDELNCNNEAQVIQKIIDEYERRLKEQLALAREDIVHELEHQIQTLLSESTTDDQHWPKELILLREKFTAKSQLEIAQLQIKHAEEMSRLKQDYEKQLNRKNKRHSTFDSLRDFDKLLGERDGLRELSKAFRQVLSELLKCVAHCENDINENLPEEMQRLLSCNRTLDENSFDDFTLSTSHLNETLNTSKLHMIPDVQSLLEVVEDPSLVQYVNEKNCDNNDDFDLKDCLERLRSEASYLLHLSEEVVRKHDNKLRRESSSSEREKHDSEQEDSLKMQQQHKFIRVNSLNEQQLPTHQSSLIQHTHNLNSLPPDLNTFYLDNNSFTTNNASELNFQVMELKNRLVKSENDRLRLQQELEHTISRNSDLGQELQHLRDQLSQMGSLNNVQYNEGYGLGSMKSPIRLSPSDSSSSFAILQEKARNILSTPTQKQQNNESTVQLLQMIEDFCREGDKVVECSRKDREDLQSQIITADKHLKATRQFLEEQAVEREQERDEFLREMENLNTLLRDKEKERSSYANASEEVEHLEIQVSELTKKLQESTSKCDKFELELKASIDKIFVLREIISDLETQVETKALNEHVSGEKVKQLEEFINSQSRSNETLQGEVQSLKTEIEQSYQIRINQLEEKLQNIRPSAEQNIIMGEVVEKLRDIEHTLEQKTKNLESLHSNTNSCSLSVTEDVSVHGNAKVAQSVLSTIVTPPQGSPVHPSPRQHSLTMESVHRVVDKLSKHSRVEEAAVKRIRDLEMQIQQMRTACVELQHERESLQERMSEQTQRISALQSRLEEQRQRAEELQRANTSDLNIRIHDLQNELQTVRETLTNRDKQIATMKQQLEKSKMAIDRLEAELAVEHEPDRSTIERLENEVKQKQVENQKLKDKIKNEMITKLALPDLMETMLADKNEEIDHLKEQLDHKQKELQCVLDMSGTASLGDVKKPEEVSTKLSGRTLSDIVSITEFDEPDVVRRAAAFNMDSPLMLPEVRGGFLQNTMESSKRVIANLTQKRTEDLSGFPNLQNANTFDNLHYFQDPNVLQTSPQSGASITPALVPRQINFSALTEDSKLTTPNYETPVNIQSKENSQTEIKNLKEKITELEKGKERNADYLLSSQVRLTNLQDELAHSQKEILNLQLELKNFKNLQQELNEKSLEIESLLREQDKLEKEKSELLSKNEKNLRNYQECENNLMNRLREIEERMLRNTENEMNERENLRKELQVISESHEQCKYLQRDNEDRKKRIELLNKEIEIKDERILNLTTKLSLAEDTVRELQANTCRLEKDIEKLKQQNSDNSSKQFSVDEIAQQVEKELNYSAQLDSNILKAIESEEENNLDRSHQEKPVSKVHPGATDDENFTGERELLNQLEALRTQIGVEREHAEDMHQELLLEKEHSQEMQEQDVVIIEAMRQRLESALEQEDELHKQLDIEKERCERLQSQLATLQRTDSRRNSLLQKSPTESPRKSLRSLNEFESELKSEIKLLSAQNERERERSADLQKNIERERCRYEKELTERVEYCEKLKRERDKVAREKDNAEMDIEHLQERLTLQTQEIESLETRIASLQEAETRRCSRKEKQHKENAQLMVEVQELKSQLFTLEADKDILNTTITKLRFDVERSAQRETKLTEALSNANTNLALHEGQTTVPEQFLQKMKEINTLLAENTQENKQMAETVQYLVEERRQLQRKCEELETQLNGTTSVGELEERGNYLLGCYLRVESHRKALVYQKRYLKISLENYQNSEQRALAAFNGGQLLHNERPKRKLFKTVALAIIAIQRMKYIGRIWHTGKRIVSKSVFTITQQKRSQPPTVSCAAVVSSSAMPYTNGQQYQHPDYQQQQLLNSPLTLMERPYAPLKTPPLLNGNRTPNSAPSSTSTATAFEWPRVAVARMNKKT